MLERIIINPEFTQEEFEKLVKYLNDCGGIEYTRNKAAGYVKKAKQALEIFKAGVTLETLLEIADYSLDRGA
jgi:octaprenyl-diphosphate synthase